MSNVIEIADFVAVMEENLAAAESSIRDIDTAKEMIQSIKNRILFKPSEAMLVQADNLPPDALRLIE